MKYFFIVLLVSLPVLLQAQTQNATVVVEVTANVLPNASTKAPIIQTLYDVNFVVYDENQTQVNVDPIRNTVGAEDGAGSILIVGVPETKFRLKFTKFVEMENVDDPSNKITVEYILSHNSVDDQARSTYILADYTELRLNKNGEYFIWVGGRIDITNLKDGDYVGGLEIEILYDTN